MAPVEYLLPDPLDFEALARGLAPSLTVEEDPARAHAAAFYDSFDGRLHADGLALVVAAGQATLVDAGETARASAPLTGAPAVLRLDDLPEGALRARLAPLVDVRALLRRAAVRGRVRPLRVLDRDGKTVARLSVEDLRLDVDAEGAAAPTLAPRLRLVALRGYDKELARVRRVLEGELGLAVAPGPLRDEAVVLAGGVPAGIASRPDVALEATERADVAAARILRALLAITRANLPGTLDDVDPEFLHDLRVSVRRARALQREFRRAFPREPLAHFRAEFRRLQAVTGPTRDLDVNLMDFDDFRAALPAEQRDDLEPLRALLSRRRAEALQQMRRDLRSPRVATLLADWNEFLAGVETGAGERLEDVATVRRAAARRIARVHRRMVVDGRAIDDATPGHALHELRKKGKELRYLLEFFSPLFPDDVVKPLVRALKGLQDMLGRFQDREVQADLLRSLADEVAVAEGGAAALIAMGRLVERLQDQQVAARAEFAERFAAFAAREQRALVRDTFG